MGKNRSRWLTGSLAATAGLVSTIGVSAPVTAQDAAPDPNTELAEQSPGIIGVGGGASARAGSPSALPTPQPTFTAASVEQRLRSHFGSRFGGVFDRPDPGEYTLVVGATSATPADLDFVEGLGRTVELVEVDHAYVRLEALHTEVDRILRDSGVTALWALNPTRNVVEVDVSALSELPPASATRLRELAALDEIVVREGFELEPTAGSYPAPRWSGVRVGVGNAGCTTGFAIANGFGRFITTAGHCGGVNSPVFETFNEGPNWTNAGQVDVIRAQAFGGGFDHASFLMPNAEGRVWNGGAFYDVKGVQNAAWLDQGYCFRGATTMGERCAGVQSVGNFTTDGRTVTGFCLGGVVAQRGDSGSGVYKQLGGPNVNAVGIMSGAGPDFSCAADMTTALAAMNSSIVTYTPPAK